jgi:hypothetical protein
MAHKITFDRSFGPTAVSAGSDTTTTTIAVTAETAPTEVTAVNYTNFVMHVAGPGDTGHTTAATCTDTQGSSYNLIKEVLFGTFALSVFSKLAAVVNVDTTVTVAHQLSKHRLIANDEWYNIGTFEKMSSAYSSTVNAAVDAGTFKVGHKNWLVYGVLAIGGSAYSDSVTIPSDWNLIHDSGTNYGDGNDVRIVVCYQVAKKRKKVEFKPVISNPRLWGAVMFSFKEKL